MSARPHCNDFRRQGGTSTSMIATMKTAISGFGQTQRTLDSSWHSSSMKTWRPSRLLGFRMSSVS